MFDTSWDWEDTFLALLVAVVVAFVTLSIVALVAPHNVDYYYVSSGYRGGYCVDAHWTWHTDEVAYCSDDKDRVLDFAAKANAILRNK